MKARLFPIAVLFAGLTARVVAADESNANNSTSEATRALLREDAKNKAAHSAPQPAPAVPAPSAAKPDQPAALPLPTPLTGAPAPVPAPVVSPAAPAPKEDKVAPAKPAAEPTTVLPTVEVSRSRITELNREIFQHEKEIEREKKNTKSTELDKALNSPKISIPILGGQTAQYRTTIASERVNLMEEERDILEQMKLVKTKEEKAELQKELDEIKAMRRDLEKNLR